jgi:succinoglycan biosynthesis protein ExoA
MKPGVSVVLPILNEERFLADAISAILAQQYLGELEVILALGPSKDRTNEIAAELRAKDSRIVLVENPTGRTAAGLNAAIAASTYEIICRIDGHAEISKSYINDAVEIMESSNAVNVGGIMAAVGKTGFENAVARAMRSPIGVGGARFHVGGTAGPADTVYLGVFKKSAINAAGGYDSRFIRAQDWELNFRLREAGGTIWFDPRLEVVYRPRPNLKALAKQYFEYGRWRRAVTRHHKGTINYRYLAPPIATLIIALSLITGIAINPLFFIPALTYATAILIASLAIGKSAIERLCLPAVLATMHISWGVGFLSSPADLVE